MFPHKMQIYSCFENAYLCIFGLHICTYYSMFMHMLFLTFASSAGHEPYKSYGTNLAQIGTNLASVTDLKRFETPHSLCCDFGGYKTFTTCWSGGRVQV